jgi:hypothetical protein
MFLRGPSDEEVYIDIYSQGSFVSVLRNLDNFNILQYACFKGMFNVVSYILHEHKILTANR